MKFLQTIDRAETTLAEVTTTVVSVSQAARAVRIPLPLRRLLEGFLTPHEL